MATQTVTTAASGLVFVNTYTANDSQAYINCIVAAEQTLESLFTNAVTFNVTFNEVASGTTGPNNFGAQNLFGGTTQVSYQQLMSKLPSADGLPGADPTGGHTWTLPEAYARMLGLSTGTPSVDDTVTLNTSYAWSFGQDVTDVIMHEISEGCMGRVGGLGDQNSLWSTMDLFRFNSAGVRDFTDGRDGQATHFSLNGSNLSSITFNNEKGAITNGGDTADFIDSDPFGVTPLGTTNTLSATDIAILQALGWNQPHVNPTVAVNDFSVVANQSVAIAPDVSVANPGGDKLTTYWVYDLGGTGHITVGGAAEPHGQWIETSSNWSDVQYVAGSAAGTDSFKVAVFDATTNLFIYSANFTATTTNPAVGGITATTIENDYAGITRGTLPLAQATAIANEINAGTQSETGYVNSLFNLSVWDTSLPAVAVEGSMYNAVGTSAEVTMLSTQFLPGQVAVAQHFGFNPIVFAAEALGLTFAFANENGSTGFANNYGPSAAMPATAAGDLAFAAAAASAVFGSAATPNLVAAIDQWVTNWGLFYSQHGLFPGQVDLAARGAAWGDAVGTALASTNLGPLLGQAINFLDDAAQGSAHYSASLVGQATHHPFP